MRIVCISDTHELHREISIPNGDLLIHGGDIAFSQNRRQLSVLRDFNDWLGELPHRHKIVIPGNHDSVLFDSKNRSLLKNATLLVNTAITIDGIQIWGSPVTPLPGEPFGMPDAADRRNLWTRIPQDTDILVTHCPPYGILDQESGDDAHQGCEELRDTVLRVRPRLHIFGHVHGSYGTLRMPDTLSVNASMLDELGGVERRPVVVPDFKAK